MSAPMENETFVREIEKNNGDVVKIHQLEIGDVGCVVWDAALVLSKYFETKDFDYGKQLHEKNVVELGAGTGVVGLIVATLGANVTITDLPEFIPLIEKNIETNVELIQGVVDAKTLVWGKESPTTEKDYDYVILADCIYYEQSLVPLVQSIIDLCSEKTVVFCCYEQRTTRNKPKLEKEFFELIRAKFNVEEIPGDRQDSQFRSDDIHIMKFMLKSP